jgi:AraC-like DNA-binding protein
MDNNFLSDLIITDVTSVFTAFGGVSENPTTTVDRKEWSISLKLEGKTLFSCNGKEYICDALHPVILPKGITYKWQCIEEGKFVALGFKCEKTGKDIIPIEIKENGTFLKYLSRIEKSRILKTTAYKMENIRDLYNILLFFGKTKNYLPSSKEEILKPAIDYMVNCYSDGYITNDSLSKLCKISTVHFRKTFESVYGISPINYLTNIRIEKAKEMLKNDYNSVSQIAENVGYNSIYHFSKMFKAYTGISPKEYAKTF